MSQFHPITKAIHEGFIDLDLKVACYTDHQIFERFHRYRLKKGLPKIRRSTCKCCANWSRAILLAHIDHGVGRFSGLEKIDINGHMQESVRMVYKNNDLLYVSINSLHKLSKYAGKDGTAPKLNKLGSDAWKTSRRAPKRKSRILPGADQTIRQTQSLAQGMLSRRMAICKTNWKLVLSTKTPPISSRLPRTSKKI